ncbi:HAD family hydrolase [Alkalimonas delamerensis]|uniref:phosphoglycolate phosphatase n=1 Tax=Alkalimonas delamerensis TaxID=265981 RepID=A0ABT9GQ11_9GAMM|nr:HAD family hydrolase [Alkalimonas delamerensis]MDP4528984.1 HAD family hydrolase [Alkalimonas delamerensis]
MFQTIFFDFDGVILDSVDVKTKAFAELFAEYGPDIQQGVVDYHLKNGGISRYEKFSYFYKELLKQPLSEKQSIALGDAFNQLALQGVLNSPFIPGAEETLQALYAKHIPMFVVSGTPHDEVNAIVDKRGLRKYFKEVHGSPKTKAAIIDDLACRYQFNASQCLFVGDAMTDYDAAKAHKLPFLGVVKADERSPFPPNTNICHRLSYQKIIEI